MNESLDLARYANYEPVKPRGVSIRYGVRVQLIGFETTLRNGVAIG